MWAKGVLKAKKECCGRKCSAKRKYCLLLNSITECIYIATFVTLFARFLRISRLWCGAMTNMLSHLLWRCSNQLQTEKSVRDKGKISLKNNSWRIFLVFLLHFWRFVYFYKNIFISAGAYSCVIALCCHWGFSLISPRFRLLMPRTLIAVSHCEKSSSARFSKHTHSVVGRLVNVYKALFHTRQKKIYIQLSKVFRVNFSFTSNLNNGAQVAAHTITLYAYIKSYYNCCMVHT